MGIHQTENFKQIAKDNQLPPGSPNIKYIYAQEYMANLQNNETVTDLTLLNSMSLEEWEQQNTEKDPGPPVCEPPFCDTGGNIDSPTLPENEVYFFHPDHLGSTSYITNISGETVQFNSYLPFGETFVSQKRTSTISNYLFNSKEVDSETGLYYYGARYYNPKISSWLSVDPIALYDPIDEVEHYLDGQHNGGYFNPRNTSVYGYTYQNPIKYIDPNGKQSYFYGLPKIAIAGLVADIGIDIGITFLGDDDCTGSCQGWLGSEFIGPTDNDLVLINPDRAVDEVDLAAFHHDEKYIKLKTGGIKGAAWDLKTLQADKDLLAAAEGVLKKYKEGGIDAHTKRKITPQTAARARLVVKLFTVLVAEKEARNELQKITDQITNKENRPSHSIRGLVKEKEQKNNSSEKPKKE